MDRSVWTDVTTLCYLMGRTVHGRSRFLWNCATFAFGLVAFILAV